MSHSPSGIVCAVAFGSVALLAAGPKASAPVREAVAEPAPAVQRANPASQHCVEQGGKRAVERGPGDGEYGVCMFPDKRQCEEWALLRGQCPSGGIRVAGYATPAARYCITGGRYTVVARSGAADEQGACTLPGGKTCDADAYYGARCSR